MSKDNKLSAKLQFFNFSIFIIMVRYVLKQCKSKISKICGKWFAYPVIEETIDLDGLSDHMSSHNSPYSAGVIRGVFTDMVKCIKELLLEGKNVKIDDLAIFSIGIKNNKGGAATEDDFSISKNISGVKLRARATGVLSVKALNLEATLKKANALTGKPTGTGDDTPSNPSQGGNTGNGSGNTEGPDGD
jgi:predicted histone-like DNA-binding protein